MKPSVAHFSNLLTSTDEYVLLMVSALIFMMSKSILKAIGNIVDNLIYQWSKSVDLMLWLWHEIFLKKDVLSNFI